MKEKLRRNNFLRNKKSFIFLLILCLGVGFAFLSTQLNITGNTSVSGNKWSVYFNKVDITEGSVEASVEPTVTGTTTTSLEYTVLLDKPGDYYEFTVEAKNDGTIDAMIDSITMTTLDSDVAKYLNYTATYEDGTGLAQNDMLRAKSTRIYKIRVEYKKDILASDLDENGIDLTLSFGINYVQSNLVESSFIKLVKNSVLSDKNLDFSKVSSDTNGKGLYVLSGTENDTNPIYYYRGAVENNNAIFAESCWNIVRTTATGGTKLIYNGKPTELNKNITRLDIDSYTNLVNESNYPYTFDSKNNKWLNNNGTGGETETISFSVKEAGNYIFDYKVNSSPIITEASISKDGEILANINRVEDNFEGVIDLGELSTSAVITIEYIKHSTDSTGFGMEFNIAKGTGGTALSCVNNKTLDRQIIENESKFNNGNSLAYSGYMYGNVYLENSQEGSISGKYGKSFTYSDGIYTLVDTVNEIDSTHHYTCNNDSGHCNELLYVNYSDSSWMTFYITLTNGKSVEDAITEMQTNTNDSSIKTVADTWFNSSIVSYFTNNGKDYNDYLEDTIWCNDRSVVSDKSALSFENSGWNPNGGFLTNYLYYNAYERRDNGTPVLTCSNKDDSFTVTETEKGNGKLQYPIGFLTSDEVILAGGQYGQNTSYYLYMNQKWWTMTPAKFDHGYASLFLVDQYGLMNDYQPNSPSAVRPSISVKSDIKIASGGDGTLLKPYQFIVE